jgi:glycerate kinase
MARASGLSLVGGRDKNDVINASTIGTGELIDAALNDGAKKIIVGVGGSATVDGGLGAIKAISSPDRLRGVEFIVACDVRALFTDAAKLFGAQKGASPKQIEFLTARLEGLAVKYRDQYGIDVSRIPGSGAAGGLAGGLAALGAQLVASHDVIITGEGYLDEESFDGKVVGGVADVAKAAGKPVVVICGGADKNTRARIDAKVLVEEYGDSQAFNHTLTCIERAATSVLEGMRR